MRDQNYRKTISVDATPGAAFQALTGGFEHWWTTPDAPIRVVGDQAKFTFPPGKSYWTLQATKLIPNSCVELECVEALHLHEGQPKAIETEWLGTKIVFQIEAKVDKTQIHLEHIGLRPSLLCYSICEAGWDFFFLDSLRAYLDTGRGKPHGVGV